MKTPQQFYEEHVARIKKAYALEEIDRPPILFNTDVFSAKYMGIKLSEFVNNVELANDMVLKAALELGNGEIDATPTGAVYPPSREMFVKMKLPGRDLPDDELWQVDEKEVMTVEDYDIIIDKGFNHFTAEYSKRKNINPGILEHMNEMRPTLGQISRKYEDAGIAVFSPVISENLFEYFCTTRSMAQFLRDLHRIPDKVQAAMDVAIVDIEQKVREQIRAKKPLTAFIGGSRAALVSKKLYERFDLPYRKRIANAIVEEGSLVHFHLDCNWDAKLESLLEMPKNKCAAAFDGTTNIFKAKEVLGDHMCIIGDVPATLLSLGTEDEVYNYCTKLVKEVGPRGYIMSAGCGAPPNAKVENMKAMIAAVTGK